MIKAFSISLILMLTYSAGVAQQYPDRSGKITDFYDRKELLVSELIQENRNIEEVLSSFEEIISQMKEVRTKRTLTRYSEVTIAVGATIGLALTKSKRLAEIGSKNIRLIRVFTGLGAGVALAGGEYYISLNNKELQELSIRLDAEKEILEREHDANSAIIARYQKALE